MANWSKSRSTRTVVLGGLLCQAALTACHGKDARSFRAPLAWSAWIEDAAVQRGYIKPGDFAQFGCPPGWRGIEETAAALRGHRVPCVGRDGLNRAAPDADGYSASTAMAIPIPPPIQRDATPWRSFLARNA